VSDRPSATESSYHEDAAGGGYFASLASAKYLLLTTFKPDGIPVSAAVHGVVDGDRAYFRAWSQSDTVKNLRHADEVQVAPCAALGLLSLAPPLDALARRLPPGEEASRVAGKLARKYPVRQRFLIPLLHRTRRWQMVHYELLTYQAAVAITYDRRASGLPDRSAIDLRSKESGAHQITVVRSSAPFPWP
jgi:PPOX class probable F420-dependent enzyme